MSLDNRITQYLDREGVPYRLIEHPVAHPEEAMVHAGLPADKLLRVQVLQHRQGLLVAVLPVNYLIDFVALNARLGSRPQPVPAEQLGRLFNDCESGCVAPIGAPYGLLTAVDDGVEAMGEVYLPAGDRRHLLAIDGARLAAMGDGQLGRISHRPLTNKSQAASRPERARRRSEALKQLPPLPRTSRRLLMMRNAAEPDVIKLAEVIAEDPALSAQLLAYARSAHFGYGGRIEDVKDAITLVLGYDMALSTALALSAAAPYKLPHGGRLGLENYWRDSLLGATLAQSLAARLPRALEVNPAQAYLAVLLHDIGLLVMGQVLEEDYRKLALAADKHPQVPISRLEKSLLGFGHGQLGGWVLRRWELPEPLSLVAAEHHNPDYSGEHAAYVALARLVDALLDNAQELPKSALTRLGIDEATARHVAAELLEDSGALEGYARKLAA